MKRQFLEILRPYPVPEGEDSSSGQQTALAAAQALLSMNHHVSPKLRKVNLIEDCTAEEEAVKAASSRRATAATLQPPPQKKKPRFVQATPWASHSLPALGLALRCPPSLPIPKKLPPGRPLARPHGLPTPSQALAGVQPLPNRGTYHSESSS